MRERNRALANEAQRLIDAIEALPDLHDAHGSVIPRSDASGDFDERYLTKRRAIAPPTNTPPTHPPPTADDRAWRAAFDAATASLTPALS